MDSQSFTVFCFVTKAFKSIKSNSSVGKKPTYAAGEGVVQRKALVTLTHGAQVGADATAISTAALIRILLRTVACFFRGQTTRLRTTGWSVATK